MPDDDVAGGKLADQDTDTDQDSAVEQESEAEGEKKDELKETLKQAIRVEVTEAGVLRKALTITVPRDALQVELDKDYKEIITEATVPGFRRGRAPRRLVEKRFGSEIGEQVQTRILPNAYFAAIEKEELKVLGDPLVWTSVKDKKVADDAGKEQLVDMATALQTMKLPSEGDLTFRCEVEIKPEFELPTLDGIRIERPKVEIDDDDVSEQIDRMRSYRGNWAPVPDGEVETDDMLVCDVKMLVDGKEAKTIDNHALSARAQVIEGVVLQDLGEKLAGAKLGDVRSVDGDLPGDYAVEDLRGKHAVFELKVNEIKRMDLPPIDQTFLTSVGFDTEEEYRAFIRQRLEGQVEQESKKAMREQVRKYLLDNTKLELPEGVSTRQTERVAARRMVELQRQGVPPDLIAKHADQLRTGAREQAIGELKLHFILEQIAETLEIEVSEEEINAAIASIAQTYNRRFDRVRDELLKSNSIDSLYLDIRDEKCIDAIREKAQVVDARVEKKKPAKKSSKAKKAKAVEETPAPEAESQVAETEKTEDGTEAPKPRPRRTPPKKE